MQVLQPNDVKIYNLSIGKSLPEWLSDRKRRALLKKDVDLQKRINLLQDFTMPAVSNCVEISPDGQYIYTAGVYKPRIRCYDVSQLAMKFERCVDSEVIRMKILSEDYSKLIMLQDERYVEIHSQEGRYFRTRIPRYGRDFDYHYPSCEACPEIYRLNLELGQYMQSLKTDCNEILCCQFNPEHNLFTLGSKEGFLECWDPRSRTRAGRLDCVTSLTPAEVEAKVVPGVSSVQYRGGLTLAAGTTTGQILLYDIRANKPFLMKDHFFGFPIRRIAFCPETELVMSMDRRILKIWEQETGKAFTSIEPPDTRLTDLCLLPRSGMLFMANEAPRVLTYYIPALGAAPRWAGFLDSLTEELEETTTNAVYDDYKFVTRPELESLGLTHLVGTKMLRAYMHGYFMDNRLYRKAKSIADPFAYDDYRKKKIMEKIEEKRKNRVQVNKLPSVNRDLAEKLMEQKSESNNKGIKARASALLTDDRFGAIFKNKDFEIDKESEDYRLLNPVVSQIEKKAKKSKKVEVPTEEVMSEEEGRSSGEESSSDDEHQWTEEMKLQHRKITREKRMEAYAERQEAAMARLTMKEGDVTEQQNRDKHERRAARDQKRSLADRLARQDQHGVISKTSISGGNMEMTFTLPKKKSMREKKHEHDARLHHKERKSLRRAAGHITKQRKQPWRRK